MIFNLCVLVTCKVNTPAYTLVIRSLFPASSSHPNLDLKGMIGDSEKVLSDIRQRLDVTSAFSAAQEVGLVLIEKHIFPTKCRGEI